MNFAKIKQEIIAYFKKQTGIVSIYIFGSTLSASAEKSNDIDIALLVEEGHEGSIDCLNIMAELSSILKKDVDLVILNGASPLLSHEIRKKGKIIFEINPSYRKKYTILKRKQFEDYLYIHSKYIRGLKKRYGK